RFECRRAEMCVPRAGPPFSRSSKRVLKLTAGAPPGSESEGAANPGACGAHQPSFLASEPTAATHHSREVPFSEYLAARLCLKLLALDREQNPHLYDPHGKYRP